MLVVASLLFCYSRAVMLYGFGRVSFDPRHLD